MRIKTNFQIVLFCRFCFTEKKYLDIIYNMGNHFWTKMKEKAEGEM